MIYQPKKSANTIAKLVIGFIIYNLLLFCDDKKNTFYIFRCNFIETFLISLLLSLPKKDHSFKFNGFPENVIAFTVSRYKWYHLNFDC